jgi:O-antigen ligase
LIRPPEADAYFTTSVAHSGATPLGLKLLHVCLFLTILVSPLVFLEPSPYEAAAALLVFACVIAGVTLDSKILPLVLLLIVLNAGVLASLIGIAGYFGLLPGAALYGRARATFKDPNVFGPFLILPLLFVMQSLLAGNFRIGRLILFCIMAFALLLSFSRGAWAHFLISTTILIVLTFLTEPDARMRARLLLLSITSVVVPAGLLTVTLSFDTVGDVFEKRAKLTQSYDVGSGGRFDLQAKAVDAMLENPAGMGPHEFERHYGGQQHNVYLQAFLVYGWVGGFAYLLLVILTVLLGFRVSMLATPWQPYSIAAIAAFCGLIAEGFVIDSDHWRHFYLLLGMIWGLAAATINALAAERRQHA